MQLLISAEKQAWRIYAGGGYLFHTVIDLKRGMLKWGLELYGLRWRRQNGTVRWLPVFGANFNALEEQKWQTTTSVKGGIEISNLPET